MFTYTYLYPDGMWAVYENKARIVAMFLTEEEAAEYCQRHNK